MMEKKDMIEGIERREGIESSDGIETIEGIEMTDGSEMGPDMTEGKDCIIESGMSDWWIDAYIIELSAPPWCMLEIEWIE